MDVASSHLTRRRLHVSHPARDFLWYRFVGIRLGFEQLPSVVSIDESRKCSHGSLRFQGQDVIFLRMHRCGLDVLRMEN